MPARPTTNRSRSSRRSASRSCGGYWPAAGLRAVKLGGDISDVAQEGVDHGSTEVHRLGDSDGGRSNRGPHRKWPSACRRYRSTMLAGRRESVGEPRPDILRAQARWATAMGADSCFRTVCGVLREPPLAKGVIGQIRAPFPTTDQRGDKYRRNREPAVAQRRVPPGFGGLGGLFESRQRHQEAAVVGRPGTR